MIKNLKKIECSSFLFHKSHIIHCRQSLLELRSSPSISIAHYCHLCILLLILAISSTQYLAPIRIATIGTFMLQMHVCIGIHGHKWWQIWVRCDFRSRWLLFFTDILTKQGCLHMILLLFGPRVLCFGCRLWYFLIDHGSKFTFVYLLQILSICVFLWFIHYCIFANTRYCLLLFCVLAALYLLCNQGHAMPSTVCMGEYFYISTNVCACVVLIWL